MSNEHYFDCPRCHQRVDYRFFEESYPVKLICFHCYQPLIRRRKTGSVKKRREQISKTAFLIHSSKTEDRHALRWVREIFRFYGVKTSIVEEDTRALDWLQKSKEGIDQNDFVVVLLTKRYQYQDDSGQLKWKGPDKCYDEIAMAFALERQVIALVEKDVDPGRVLERVAWCYFFERGDDGAIASIEDGQELFQKLDQDLGNVTIPPVTYVIRKGR